MDSPTGFATGLRTGFTRVTRLVPNHWQGVSKTKLVGHGVVVKRIERLMRKCLGKCQEGASVLTLESCPSCQSCLPLSSSCLFFLVVARQQKQHCHTHRDTAGHLVQNHGVGAVGNV